MKMTQLLSIKVYPFTLTVNLRCMATLSGKVSLLFTYLLPFSRGVYSQRKEFVLQGKKFAPLGANSFLLE